MQIDAAPDPSAIARLTPQGLRGRTCVVFDILRATTTMVTALAHGAEAIYPVTSIDEALALKGVKPTALLGGERGGGRIAGFDLGNSPREYLDCAGREIIMTTTNGTRALRACQGARAVYAAGFVNLRAMTDHLLATCPEHLLMVCAGTGNAPALEDGLAAGALMEALGSPLTDAALALRDLHRRNRHQLESVCRSSGNGAALERKGRGEDIAWAFQRDAFPILAQGIKTGDGLMLRQPPSSY